MDMAIVEYILKIFLVAVIACIMLPALASVGGSVIGIVVAVFSKRDTK